MFAHIGKKQSLIHIRYRRGKHELHDDDALQLLNDAATAAGASSTIAPSIHQNNLICLVALGGRFLN